MIIEASLFGVFLISLFFLWYRLSQRLPELIAIPDQVITARLEEDSARLRLHVLHLKSFYKEQRYKDFFWKFCGKLLFRLHIFVLRLDNGIVARLNKIRSRIHITNEAHNGDFWRKLRDEG